MRQRSRGHDGTATAEDLLPLEIRRRREERELSHENLAEITGYSRRYISQLEHRSRGIPALPVLKAVDAALAAGGALVRLRHAAAEARSERLRRRPDPEVESRRRIHDLLDRELYDRKLDFLDRGVAELIESVEHLTPAGITTRVQDQQHLADVLLDTRMLPHQQLRLFMLAGHLAALQAVALLDDNEFQKASTCCLEAAVFTELTGHEGLRAWTLAVNSLIEAAVRNVEKDRAYPRLDGTTTETSRTMTATSETATSGDTISLENAGDSAQPPMTSPSAPTPDELLVAPGGLSTPPILVAIVKDRVARFATATAERTHPPAGPSRTFRPPV